MNLAEIAAAAGISKSAAQRFAYTFERLGVLRKDPISKRFSLATRVLDLGCRYLQAHSLLERANPYLLDLNRASGETVNLAEPDGSNMVYIGRFPSPVRSIVHMPIGRPLPMFCTSAGRAYLSGLPDTEVIRLLDGSPRPKYTEKTVTDLDELLAIVHGVREKGYALCVDEYYRGDIAIGVPLLNLHGEPVAAVNISVSTVHWTVEEALKQLVPQLLETANLITTKPPTPSALSPFNMGYGKNDALGQKTARRR
ncbi:IclR family transcriptional regulator [Cupriavidus sp. 8B]